MIRWNGKNWIPAGVKPVVGRRRGAPVPGRPKARWVAGWVGGLGDTGQDCDFTYELLVTPTPTPSSSVTPTVTPSVTVTPTASISPTPSITPTPSPSQVSGDPDANAYITRVTNAGGTLTSAEETAIEDLFTTLKSDGIYSKLGMMHLYVGGNSASHALNALGDTSFDITWNGGLTHTTSGGTVGNGTNGYGDTAFNPYVEIGTSVGEPRHLAVYTSLNTNLGMEIGGYDGNNRDFIASRLTNQPYFRLGDTSSMTGFGVRYDSFNVVNRTGSTYQEVYYRGSLVQTNTQTNTVAPPNVDYYVARANGTNFYSDKALMFTSAGEGLTPTDQVNFEDAVQAFQVALGRNSYT